MSIIDWRDGSTQLQAKAYKMITSAKVRGGDWELAGVGIRGGLSAGVGIHLRGGLMVERSN